MNNRLTKISSRDLKNQVWLTQVIWLLIIFILLWLIIDDFQNWLTSFRWSFQEALIFGCLSGLVISFINIWLMKIFPKKHWDDGGINEKIFQEGSRLEIMNICLVIAILEEVLFRGIIQTEFGYVMASSLFALVHFRYLKKPLLLFSILFWSFGIGYLFLLTKNLLVVITLHFVLDVTLALRIRRKGEWG